MAERRMTQAAVRYGRQAAVSPKDPPAFTQPSGLPYAWQTVVNPADIILDITVPGEPVPKGRPRMSRARISDNTGQLVQGHAYTPKETRDAETALRWIFTAARRIPAPTPHPVGVLCWYRSRHGRADADNCFKLTGDALNGTVLVDDQQIVEHHVHMLRHCTEPGMSLLVWTTNRRVPGA